LEAIAIEGPWRPTLFPMATGEGWKQVLRRRGVVFSVQCSVAVAAHLLQHFVQVRGRPYLENAAVL